MRKIVLDTNVYVEAMRRQDAAAALEEWQRRHSPFLWLHAVVAAEVLAGAGDELTWRRWRARWMAPAEAVRRVITPRYSSWIRATRIISRLVAANGISRPVKQSFLRDCLIAATARETGHAIVTHNRADYETIAGVEPGLEILPVLP